MPEQLPPEVKRLSAATKLIYHALEDGPMTVDELETQTGLSAHTIRKCGDPLETVGAIKRGWDSTDARKRVYRRIQR